MGSTISDRFGTLQMDPGTDARRKLRRIVFGAMTGTYAASVQANLPTPWLGVWERVDAGLLMLWLIVLAVALPRRQDTTASSRSFQRVAPGGASPQRAEAR